MIRSYRVKFGVMALLGAGMEQRAVCGGCSCDGALTRLCLRRDTKAAQFGLEGFKDPC